MKLISHKKLSSHTHLKKCLLPFKEHFKQSNILSRNKRSNEKTLEEATQKGRFDYWLSQEDIADIARLEYRNFKPQNNLELADFEIIGSSEQLMTQVASFLLKIKHVDIARHTLIINLGDAHWVSLVFYHEQAQNTAYFVNSLGDILPDKYHSLFSNFNTKLIDLSQYCHPQQTDPYNCGLWALENAADLNQMLDEKLSIDWVISRLKRPRTSAYFSERRQLLSEILRNDLDRIRRLIQPNPTLAEKKTIIGSRRPFEYSSDLEPLAKKTRLLSKQEKLSVYLEVFVEEFMLNFVKRVGLYHLTAKENRISEESFRNELKTGTTGALIGFGIAQTFAGALPAMLASIRTLSSHYFTSKTKARKITRSLSNLPENNLDQILSEAGVAIFKSYESQFMQVTDKAGDRIAIEKLAEDAAARALNYIAENQDSDFFITTETITRGVIFGKSEKFFDPSFKNLRIRISGSRIHDKEGNSINSANLYEKTGLMIVNPKDQSEKLYRGKSADSTKYGYRQALDWEIEENDLRRDYKERYFQDSTISPQENQFQYFSRKYQYLNYPEPSFIKQSAQSILQKILQLSDSNPPAESISNTKKGPILFNLGKPVENFSGRKEVLSQLHQLLMGKNIGVVTHLMTHLSLNSDAKETQTKLGLASISGLGGMGKTQVALRYAQQYAAEYDNNVIWINAETKYDISLCLIDLANRLDIKIKDNFNNVKNTNELIQEVYRFFNQEKSLFIFDNVENYREFADFFPKTLIGNTPTLLITSRFSLWKNIAPILSIDIFTEQETKDFIKKELLIDNNQQDSKIKELHTLLQGLPLALQQAVAYITLQKTIQNHYGISEYLDQFKEKSEECLNFDFFTYSNDPYVKTVFLTWQLTLEKIKQTPKIGEKALEILNIMGYIHPDHIANNLFLPLEHSEKLGEAIHLLRSYSMINQQNQPDISTIHRLVQQVVRINLERDVDAFRKTAEKIIKITENYFKVKETELHYIHFLLYISQNDALALSLNLGYTRRRVLDTLVYSFHNMNILTIYDNARLIMNKEHYYYFMGESLHYFLKRGFLFILSETLNYLEKCIIEEILTLEDVKSILDHRYKAAVKFKGRWLVPGAVERARQLGALQLFFEFENKLFPQTDIQCFPRKKRDIINHCISRSIFAAKRISSYEFVKQLELAEKIAEFASLGLLSKDMLSALLQGKLSNVAMTLSLIGSSRLLGEFSHQMRVHGQRLTAIEEQRIAKNLNLNDPTFSILFDEEVLFTDKTLFLGNSLNIAAPFVGKSASLFSNTHYLYNAIYAYRQNNSKQGLPDLIASALSIGIDGIQSGIDVAEDLRLIEGVSEFSGPLGEIASTSIWLTSEIEHAVQQELAIENYVHLDWTEKIWQGLRAIAHYPPSAYIETKMYNNKLVDFALSYLKNQTDLQAYIFPSAHSNKTLEIDSLVFLKNKTRIRPADSMPDGLDENKERSPLFCLYGVEESKFTEAVKQLFEPFYEIYLCKKAIGVEYTENRTGNIHLIALGEGNDRIEGSPNNPTIIHVDNGNKHYFGSDVGTLFILEGYEITGIIVGGKGINIIKFGSVLIDEQQTLPLIDFNGLICRTMSRHVCKQGLEFKQIQRIFGIKDQPDIFYLSKKDINYVDGFSGKDPFQRDHIYITTKTATNLEIILRSNTVIHASDRYNETTTILYTLHKNQTGEAWLHFDFSGPIMHHFQIEFPFDALRDIFIYPQAFSFQFIQQQASFNLTLCFPLQNTKQSQAEMLNQLYYIFPNNLQVRLFNQKYLHILENNRNLIESIRYYSSIAQQLKRTLSIHFAKNEMLQMSYEKHEFLSNDFKKRSHLMAQGEQTLYRIISGDPHNFPLPEIILYKNHKQPLFANSLDLTEIWQQAKQLCPKNDILLRVYQCEQDLIISVEVNYYLLTSECVRLEKRTWPITKIKLYAACVDNWYQDLEIILPNTSLAIFRKKDGQWFLEKYPLIFNSNKAIIVLTLENIEFQRNIIILKLLSQNPYHFYCHNKTDLFYLPVWKNNTHELMDDNIIIFSRFYQDQKMREQTLASTLHFLDRKIILKEYQQSIELAQQHCLNLSNRMASTRAKRDISKNIKMLDPETTSLIQYKNSITPSKTVSKTVTYKTKKRKPIKKSIKKISYHDKNFRASLNQKFTSEKNSPLLLKSSNETVNPHAISSIDNLARFNQQNNPYPTLFNNASIDQTPLNFWNAFLLYTTLFKKPKKSAKTFSNSMSEIDEIEQRVMKALKNKEFH